MMTKTHKMTNKAKEANDLDDGQADPEGCLAEGDDARCEEDG